MKTLYSSTFLTVVLIFLALLGRSGTPVVIARDVRVPAFQTILEPIGPALSPADRGKVRVEVFNSFSCQSCDLFGQNVLPELVKKYAEHDQVDMRLYLIPDRESESELYAVRGAHCAAKYGQFWDLTYKMHAAEVLNKREVDLLGQEMELPLTEFRQCLGSEESDEVIGESISYAESMNVRQNPTILVDGTVLLGNQPIENIDRVINKKLNN